MGYAVPEIKDVEEYLGIHGGVFFNYLDGTGQVDAMRTLHEAYWNVDHLEIFQRTNEWYDKLYGLCQGLGLTDGKSKEEFFPNLSPDNFKNDFSKLWNSLTVYHDMINSQDNELKSNASLYDIYQNYETNYDHYLMAEDVFNTLTQRQIVKKGYEPDKLKAALQKLYFYKASYKNDEEFNDTQLTMIQEETKKLNKVFSRTITADRPLGIFSGMEIKKPADLQNYIDRYETMLLDLTNYGSKTSFENYALRYNEAEHDITPFETKMVARLNREAENAENDIKEHKEWMEFLKLESDDMTKAEMANVVSTAKEEFDKKCNEVKVTSDKELEALEAEYKKEKKLHEEDLIKYRKIVKNIKAKEWKTKENDYQAYIDDLYNATVNFDKEYENERQGQFYNFNAAVKSYKEGMLESFKEANEFDAKIRKESVKLNNRQEEGYERNHYDQNELDAEKERIRNEIINKTGDIKGNRQSMAAELNKIAEDIPKQIKKSYEDELADKKKRLRASIQKMKDAKAEMDRKFKNSVYGQSENREICDKLTEVTNVLNSEKKTIFKIKRKDSDQYVRMMNAIEQFKEGKIGAEDAHKACEDYLKTSLDTKTGTISNMGSKLGRLRKQSCVRMMEILSTSLIFDKEKVGIEKTGQTEKEAENNNSKNVKKDKISYTTLEKSLAKKSDSVKGNGKSQSGKAFSNLNKKIAEQKAAKQKATKQKATKQIEAPSKSKQ